MKNSERCYECGSWEAQCGSETPVEGCGCARCANHSLNKFKEYQEFYDFRMDQISILLGMNKSGTIGELYDHVKQLQEELKELEENNNYCGNCLDKRTEKPCIYCGLGGDYHSYKECLKNACEELKNINNTVKQLQEKNERLIAKISGVQYALQMAEESEEILRQKIEKLESEKHHCSLCEELTEVNEKLNQKNKLLMKIATSARDQLGPKCILLAVAIGNARKAGIDI